MRNPHLQDLWDVRATLRCCVCDRQETDTYSRLMHSDHWPLDHDTSIHYAYRLAYLNILEGNSNLGQFSLQVLDESVVSEPTTCPNGHAGFSVILVAGSSVFRFRDTGDLLFVRPTSQMTCADPSTGVSFFQAALGEIMGGTGRFAHATGTLEGEGMARVLLTDPVGNVFAEQHGTITGTIILP
jgi:hypothetical protein